MTLKDIYAAYANLDIRPERNEAMIKELDRVGLSMERLPSFWWKDLWNNGTDEDRHRWGYMKNVRKTEGAIGCWESQIEIMKRALAQNKSAWVNEDDLVFCSDIHERLEIIFDFLKDKDWDIFWMGSTFHKDPTWHKLDVNGKHSHRELQQCNCTLNKDYELTDNPYIVRTYGAFSTHSWIINKDKIKKHIDLMNEQMHFAMGVDWFYILNQPNMNCYAFNVGCVKQYDSYSNIGKGWANQSGFEHSLGSYWFQDKMI